MRRLIVLDHTYARIITGSDDPRHHEETPIEFEVDPVNSLVFPLGTDPQMRSYRLRNAAQQLGAVVTRMPDVLKSAEARAVMRALGTGATKSPTTPTNWNRTSTSPSHSTRLGSP